jgi:hypothetical protein
MITPKIVLSIDNDHTSLEEGRISRRLASLLPEDKIIFFPEERPLEQPSIGQYSLKLLAGENSHTTASAVNLLLEKMMSQSCREYDKNILISLYSDRYFKKLVMEDHISRYTPEKHLQCQSEPPTEVGGMFERGFEPLSN